MFLDDFLRHCNAAGGLVHHICTLRLNSYDRARANLAAESTDPGIWPADAPMPPSQSSTPDALDATQREE